MSEHTPYTTWESVGASSTIASLSSAGSADGSVASILKGSQTSKIMCRSIRIRGSATVQRDKPPSVSTLVSTAGQCATQTPRTH